MIANSPGGFLRIALITRLCYWAGIFLHPWRIDANLDFYAAITGRVSAA